MNKHRLDLSRVSQHLRRDSSWFNKVITHTQVPSTQSMAISAGNMGAPEGTVIIAGQQVSGRGRGGHQWYSPPGGLYASIVLRPRGDVKEWPVLSLMAGVAIARTIKMLGVSANLKWPNDVNINGLKVAGCLARAVPEKGFVALGIGVNLMWAENISLPDDIRKTATSLYEHLGDKALPPEAFAANMLIGIVNLYRTSTDNPAMNFTRINAILDHETLYNFKGLKGAQQEVLRDLSLRLRDQTGNTHILGLDYAAGD